MKYETECAQINALLILIKSIDINKFSEEKLW